MISYEEFQRIKQLQEEGLKASQIAAKLQLDCRTADKWMHRDRFQPRKTSRRSSKLDPFKDEIFRMLEKHPYSAVQVSQQLKEQGFDGGYTIVKDYVRKVRPRRRQAFLKLAFAPGECAQVDWGSFGTINVGSTSRRLSFFVMVLCHSRMMYVEFTVRQTMEHFLGCHQRAFDLFGGVPKRIMVDNLKSAVLRRITGQAPVFNPRYLDFAGHHGFTISACGVGKGNEKGRVENAVGYVKKNFLAGLDLPDFSAMNHAVRHWLDSVANVRIHGETRKRPLAMLAEEAALLFPLPPHGYDIGVIKQVRASKQFRVALDGNRYSVPAQFAGAVLTMKTYPDRVCLYHQENLIARHVRTYDRGKDIEDSDHPKALLTRRRKARDQKVLMRFMTLSPRAVEYYQGLEKRCVNLMNHVRRIVALSEIYSTEAVARALEDGCDLQAFSCDYIANLLQQRKNLLPEPGPLHLTRAEDLLELDIGQPDMTIYNHGGEK